MNLYSIENPSFLKGKSDEELKELAQDIREFLIQSCSETGGHIGANLGVVELSIALHKYFDSPTDKFIFDVGHQAYIHKILTGRISGFDTLRQYKGLCGFPKVRESEHDVWEAGHSSTSLSAAMGMAKARDIQGGSHHVVPVIGDGALTGGMALEALNHIGSDRTNMTIILNDNEMSIAPNVGAMHNMLGRMRTNTQYNRVKHDIEDFINGLPQVGSKLRDMADRIKDSMKYLVVNGIFFEELGIKYIGPVDGHDFEDLARAIKSSKDYNGPVVVHVITKKGKGYHPAEADKLGKWHGLGPYKIDTGEVLGSKTTPSWSEFMSNTVLEYAKEDDRIVAMTPAMPVGSKLTKFQNELPERFFDVGIAEQHAVTMAGGLAAAGMKPYLAIYSTFLQRGYDQLLHDVDRQNLNVMIGIDRSGLVGADGETHQGVFDISFISPLPNMTLMMPKDEVEARQMIDLSIRHEGPAAIRYPRGNVKGLDMTEGRASFELGEWEEVVSGEDIAVISFGPTLDLAIAAAAALKESGIDAKVINARFIKPLDEKMLLSLGVQNIPIVSVEESMLAGGLGSMIASFMADHHFTNPIKRIGIDSEYVEHGDVNKLLDDIGISVGNIILQSKTLLEQTNEKEIKN
ncbi:1-deoxy-D-xylulose-5-phosphate synthase [Salinicoccus halodurans]|uniref:1-deoxy-D-xylulose-5-phosphate synthase n=1 Tax=Salinicoccus halodurans TaxID=407035 RepID=A0A0F7D4D3_9STAP|nr:1-deoxy-D-xylulose-5-phosphate synthase [Salinicoccus halodurans]AKG74035.1 1-deoxy-D-xylulose-5-phosphate synthase [Salinicoccus halodurans]SFK59477.1 1-deoxy-D-xylulose-5-phosphate synthase [Salinicoccus halodurans]